MTERMASRWMTFGGGWIQGAKADSEDAVKMVETTRRVQLGGDITKKAKKCKSGVEKEAYTRQKKEMA